MKLIQKVGIATVAATVAACFALPATAGGLSTRYDRSTKDSYVPQMREVHAGGAGPCYFRADIGYSISRDPSIKWPVSSIDRTYTDNDFSGTYNAGDTLLTETFTYIGDAVTDTNLDSTLFGEAGFGCGTGSRGFRAELMFGVRGERDLDGKPATFTVTENAVITQPDSDPMHASLRTYTMMANVYKDMGNYGGFTPYVGVGAGLAYHRLSEISFTGNPNLVNSIAGNNDLSFAWSLMAGVGYQVSERAVLDFGYRFIDMGGIKSGRVDSAGFVNPAVVIDDLRAHEFKVGLRYHFGGPAREVSYK